MFTIYKIKISLSSFLLSIEEISSRCITNLNGFLINSAWMDQNTAIYESDFISEKHNDKSGPLNFLGYDLQEWIYIQLNPNVFPLCHMKNPISYALSLNDDFNLLN